MTTNETSQYAVDRRVGKWVTLEERDERETEDPLRDSERKRLRVRLRMTIQVSSSSGSLKCDGAGS
jgi:hypothetical protein